MKVRKPVGEKLTINISNSRLPKKVKDLGVHAEEHPVLQLALLDLEHAKWGWKLLSRDDLEKVIKFFQEIEKLTWKEIRAHMTGGERRRGLKHKFIPFADIIPLARSGLNALELDDADDSLFRFRLDGKMRLWGIVHEPVFYPVWLDLDHEICPSGKTNT